MKNIRKYWENKRKCLSEQADAIKDSQSVAFGLLEEYDNLHYNERVAINDILAEWLLSDDETLRYDACFLISQRCIVSLVNEIKKAILCSQKRSEPGQKYEIKKLKRILNELNESIAKGRNGVTH